MTQTLTDEQATKVIDEMIRDLETQGVEVTAPARDLAIQHRRNIAEAKPDHGVIGRRQITRWLPELKA
jgi:hypothetical protein